MHLKLYKSEVFSNKRKYELYNAMKYPSLTKKKNEIHQTAL